MAQRERHEHERGQREPHGEQRERIRHLDRQRPDDVAGAPEEDEDRQEEAVGHEMHGARRAARDQSHLCVIDTDP